MLTPLVLLIMERVSPTVHLGDLSCIFCTTLTAFLVLVCTWKIPIRGRLLQTLVLLFKSVLDLMPTILGALNSLKRTSLEDGNSGAFLSSRHTVISRLDDAGTKIWLVDYILLCCSSICITSLEVSFRFVNDIRKLLILSCSTSTYGLHMKKSLRRASDG